MANYPGMPKSMSLLVVEDEQRLRELLLDLAPDAGYVATGARTAEEAIRLLSQSPRDIVLLDLHLPGMDGIELLSIVHQRWPLTQVVVLTGFGSLEAAQKAIHFNVAEFLTKPCPLNQIEQALDKARRRIDTERAADVAAFALESEPVEVETDKIETLSEHERKLIFTALARNNGNRTAAAAELGISRRTLHYRLQEYQDKGLMDGLMDE